ncbi:MAG: DNA-binding protein HU-beta [Solirubrobacteraceae bacterium]
MRKSEFVERVALRSGLSRAEAGRALEAILALVVETLREGGDVALPGFGRFHCAKRGARAGVNPRTGEPMMIAATPVPRFTAGVALKKAARGQ